MSRHRRRSGPVFWIGTFLIGLFSQDRGKRRINAQMAQLRKDIEVRDQRIATVEDENHSLTERLTDALAERNWLREWAAGQWESQLTDDGGKTPADTDNEATASFAVYTPPETVEPFDNTELTKHQTESTSVS